MLLLYGCIATEQGIRLSARRVSGVTLCYKIVNAPGGVGDRVVITDHEGPLLTVRIR